MDVYTGKAVFVDEILLKCTLESQNINLRATLLPVTVITNDMTENVDVFNPTDGQTEFEISLVPRENTDVEMYVNGVNCDSFTLVDMTITYTGTNYSLTSTDFIKIIYFT